MVQQGSSRKKVVRDAVHLDFLRKALEWAVDAGIFQDMRTHGNTNWIAKELVGACRLLRGLCGPWKRQ